MGPLLCPSASTYNLAPVEVQLTATSENKAAEVVDRSPGKEEKSEEVEEAPDYGCSEAC